MNKYTFNMTLSASSDKEAEDKMKSLCVLASRLNAKELNRLADIIQNDPVKTAMAKKALGV